MSRRIGRGFKPDDRFAGLGVAEFLAGEAFDGLRIVLQRVNLRLKLFGFFLLGLKLLVQLENFRAIRVFS